MKNIKKITSLITTIAIFFSMTFVPANAANITDIKVNWDIVSVGTWKAITQISFTVPANVKNVQINYWNLVDTTLEYIRNFDKENKF